jgi:hypothetical protein
VTISGLSFGSSMASGTASLEADGACASTAWTSSTSVGCAGATLSGSGRRTAVSVSGLVGTMLPAHEFSFDGMLHCVLCSSSWKSCCCVFRLLF